MSAVLQSPSYQPAAEFTRWLELNKRALIARWWECSTALLVAGDKLGVQVDEVEFDAFCRAQFDLSKPHLDFEEDLPDSFYDDDKRERDDTLDEFDGEAWS